MVGGRGRRVDASRIGRARAPLPCIRRICSLSACLVAARRCRYKPAWMICCGHGCWERRGKPQLSFMSADNGDASGIVLLLRLCRGASASCRGNLLPQRQHPVRFISRPLSPFDWRGGRVNRSTPIQAWLRCIHGGCPSALSFGDEWFRVQSVLAPKALDVVQRKCCAWCAGVLPHLARPCAPPNILLHHGPPS